MYLPCNDRSSNRQQSHLRVCILKINANVVLKVDSAAEHDRSMHVFHAFPYFLAECLYNTLYYSPLNLQPKSYPICLSHKTYVLILTYVSCHISIYKGKAVPLQAWSGPEGSRKLRFPDFLPKAQDGGRIVSLTHRSHLPPGNNPGTNLC
jgi:hypothetical protein